MIVGRLQPKARVPAARQNLKEAGGTGLTNGNPLHLLRHPHGKRGSADGPDRTKVEFGGCLTRKKLAVNADLLWGNCILTIKTDKKSGRNDRKKILN